jgi:phage terminase large subunit-like protein
MAAKRRTPDWVDVADKYVRDVLSGKRRECKWVRLACERQKRDLERKLSKRWPYYFDRWSGNDFCEFASKVPHCEGIWNEANVLELQPWQAFIFSTVWGWRRVVGREPNPETDPRRYDTVYIETARKQGKSFMSSPVAVYCVACEGEKGPQVKLAATTYKQTEAVFRPVKHIVESTPDLREAFGLEAYAKAVVCMATGGNIEPIHAKGVTQEGLNPHCYIMDELHAHSNRRLFDVLRSARGARTNPLSWYITTAGYNPQGVCYEQRTLVAKILEGLVPGDHYFGVIYTLDAGEDPFDESVWIKANPNLGVSKQLEQMREYALEAKHSPMSRGEFLTKDLNLWQEGFDRLIDPDEWDACADPSMRMEDFEGCPAWIGADLADTSDIAAAGVLFIRDGVPHWFPRFYLAEDLVDRLAHTTGAHYRVWADEGRLVLTPGAYIDHGFIERDIRDWFRRFHAVEAALDHYGSSQMTASLNEDGFTTLQIGKSGRTYTDPTNDLLARIAARKFRHDGHPVMRWNASNAVGRRGVDGSIVPKKEDKNSPNKIDGLDALLQAMGRAMLGGEPPRRESVYETRGLVRI